MKHERTGADNPELTMNSGNGQYDGEQYEYNVKGESFTGDLLQLYPLFFLTMWKLTQMLLLLTRIHDRRVCVSTSVSAMHPLRTLSCLSGRTSIFVLPYLNAPRR